MDSLKNSRFTETRFGDSRIKLLCGPVAVPLARFPTKGWLLP